MKNIIYVIIISSLIYTQCEYSNAGLCNNSNENCEWIENIETGSCGSLWGEDCELNPECDWNCWSDDQGYMGWCTYSCDGGTYSYDNGYCQEIEMPECSEMEEEECESDGNCDWMEDIDYASCLDLTASECNQYFDYGCVLDSDCVQWGSWYTWLCYGYGPSYCTGGTYEIDTGTCEEIVLPECSEEYEFQCTDGSCIPIHRVCNNINDCEDGSDEINCENCSELLEFNCSNVDSCEWIEGQEDCENLNTEFNCNSDNCNWIEDFNYYSCSGFNQNQCYQYDECDWTLSYGGSYGQWSYTCSGSYEIDNSYCYGEAGYCEEMQYQLGDVNLDGLINVIDVVESVELIISSEYDNLGDLNQDGVLNISDVIILINIILNN